MKLSMSQNAPEPKIRLGADPEVFLTDAAGAYISSIGKIGGTKDHPRPLPLGQGFCVQEDNVALEYNIPPASSKKEFIKNITKISKYLAKQIAKQGLLFSQQSAIYFPEDQLNDPKALEFGCDPDYNAWTEQENPKPRSANPTLRSCGGHVHVGVNVPDIIQAVKLCDLFLGVPSTIMDKGFLRKSLYGKWGAFRAKPYGFEYRVLSNYWTFSPKLIGWVWDNMEIALNNLELNVDAERDAIHEAINNNNIGAAEMLIGRYNIPVLI